MLVACRYGPCEIADLQERMKRAVALLGEEEVKNIMRDEGKIEVGSYAQPHLWLLCKGFWLVLCFQHVCMGVTSVHFRLKPAGGTCIHGA